MPQTEAQKLTILERRKRVAEAYLRGQMQWQTARQEGVDRGTIARDLAAIRADWLASSIRDFDAARAEQLAKVDRIEQLATDGWERSCRDAEALHVRTESEGGRDEQGRPVPTKTIQEKTTQGRAGDPRFLERMAWCVSERCRILGLYAKLSEPPPPAPVELNVHVTLAERVERVVGICRAALERGGVGADRNGNGGDPSRN